MQQNLLIDIVVKLVVAGEGKQDTETWSKWKENLRRCVKPNLKTGLELQNNQSIRGADPIEQSCTTWWKFDLQCRLLAVQDLATNSIESLWKNREVSLRESAGQ